MCYGVEVPCDLEDRGAATGSVIKEELCVLLEELFLATFFPLKKVTSC